MVVDGAWQRGQREQVVAFVGIFRLSNLSRLSASRHHIHGAILDHTQRITCTEASIRPFRLNVFSSGCSVYVWTGHDEWPAFSEHKSV